MRTYKPEDHNMILQMMEEVAEYLDLPKFKERPEDPTLQLIVDKLEKLIKNSADKVFCDSKEYGELSVSQRKSFNKKKKYYEELKFRLSLLSDVYRQPSRRQLIETINSKIPVERIYE